LRSIGFTSWLSRDISLEASLQSLETIGCREVEIAAMPDYLRRPESIRASLEKHGMTATAVSLGVPFFYSGSRLDLASSSAEVRAASVAYVRESVDFARDIRAGFVYVCSILRGTPSMHQPSLLRLERALAECADHAEGLHVRFGLEPFPAGELPTVKEAASFIASSETRNLGILLDTGHAAISGERLSAAALAAKGCISHVHINNNDGSRDLHWPPQKGKLSRAEFAEFLTQLADQGYSGVISLEVSRPEPVTETLSESRSFLERIMSEIPI
jgi:sugar phosphate isomerase/epimerase